MNDFTGLPSHIDTLDQLSDEITKRNLLNTIKCLEECDLKQSFKEVVKYYLPPRDWAEVDPL
jgi:hypothetical protein